VVVLVLERVFVVGSETLPFLAGWCIWPFSKKKKKHTQRGFEPKSHLGDSGHGKPNHGAMATQISHKKYIVSKTKQTSILEINKVLSSLVIECNYGRHASHQGVWVEDKLFRSNNFSTCFING
jgi:hypothetical protein